MDVLLRKVQKEQRNRELLGDTKGQTEERLNIDLGSVKQFVELSWKEREKRRMRVKVSSCVHMTSLLPCKAIRLRIKASLNN